jgi:DNA polymerase-3 subunit alpha
MYIAECKDMGIAVLPPDINESKLDFLSQENGIRFGLLAIRNVGEGAIRSILQFRDQNKRFRGLFQFCEEVDSRSLNKRVMESLVKSGALDSLGWKRSQLMAMVDTAIEYGQKARRDRESGQKGLFAQIAATGQSSSSEPDPPDMPEWPLEQRLAFEKETLGFYVSGHPLNRFAVEIARFSKKSISELSSEGKSVECKMAGIITDVRQRRTKKGDLMAIFTLEDLSGAIETVVFPNAYQKFESFLTADYPVLVTGRFEKEDDRNCKLIASDLQPLSGINQRNAKTLRIRANLSSLNPESAIELHRLLENNRGETGVEVELYNPSSYRVNIESADFVKVKSSEELIQQIETICGAGSVLVVN